MIRTTGTYSGVSRTGTARGMPVLNREVRVGPTKRLTFRKDKGENPT